MLYIERGGSVPDINYLSASVKLGEGSDFQHNRDNAAKRASQHGTDSVSNQFAMFNKRRWMDLFQHLKGDMKAPEGLNWPLGGK